MRYEELIERVLKGRSVNAVAKEIGIPQKTFDRYCKGDRVPDYAAARKLAKEAGVKESIVFSICADLEEERNSRSLMEKLSANFEYLMSHIDPRRSLFSAR
jgi:transcriptional regulator with XRE-family HTH domain